MLESSRGDEAKLEPRKKQSVVASSLMNDGDVGSLRMSDVSVEVVLFCFNLLIFTILLSFGPVFQLLENKLSN